MKKVIQFESKVWLACLVFGLTILNTQFASAQATEIAEAKHLQEIDQNLKSIDVLTKATTSYPAAASAYYYLGIAQLKAGQRDAALKTFDKGIAADPKEGLNYVGKGHLSMLENNAQKAKLDFDKALSMTKSKNVPVMQAIAEAYMVDAKLSKEAMNVLTKAKAVDDHDAETHILIGDSFLQQNQGGQAVSSYERAASLNPKLAKPHYKIGLVYLRSRNFDAAQEAFNKAVELDPNYTLAYKEQGELYYQLKKAKEAVVAYQKYLTLTEKPEAGQFKMAFYLLMAKDFAKANEVFKGLVQKPDVTAMTIKYYGVSLYEAGDYAGAQTQFENYFTKAKPEEIEAGDYRYYGLNMLKQGGKDSLAMESFTKSLTIDPKQPELLQLQADTYYKMKKFPQSIDAYNELFLVKKPASADYFTLGRAYYFNSQFVQADSTFAILIGLQPAMTVGYLWKARSMASQDPETEKGLAKPDYEKLVEKALPTPDKNKADLIESYLYLGYYFYLKGDKASAKANYQKVIALDPSNVKATEALNALKQG